MYTHYTELTDRTKISRPTRTEMNTQYFAQFNKIITMLLE